MASKGVISEFRQFLLRGNVVDLAVAVVVGAAFNAVVQSFVRDIITPLIASIGGQHNFAGLTFQIHHSVFAYGDFTPINRLNSVVNRRKTTEDPDTRKCPECLSEIPSAASRCKYCTAKIEPTRASA